MLVWFHYVPIGIDSHLSAATTIPLGIDTHHYTNSPVQSPVLTSKVVLSVPLATTTYTINSTYTIATTTTLP